MARLLIAFSIFLVASLQFSNVASGENWPGWRGARGDGTSIEKSIPTRWDGATGENIAWKTPIPGVGHSSPVAWGDRIFVVSCIEDKNAEQNERVLLCLDRHSGKILWQQTVLKSLLETKHSLNSHASGTPVTDGKLVYVTFLDVDGSTIPARNVGRARPVTPGKITVAAYDFDGKQKWKVAPGNFVSVHGYCSCPVLYKDLVIVNGDHDGDGFLVALNRSTGETVWKVDRDHNTRSYVTPIIREVAGRTEMVLSGSKCVCSYDPSTGKRHWKIDGPTEQYVASMVFDGEKFYMAAGFPTYHVMGILPGGSGNVTDTHVAWHIKNVRCYVPSPVVVDKYLLVADDRGTANCFDTATGERLWQDRLGKHFSASLVTANGLVYFLADDGEMSVVRPGKTLDVVSQSKLGEYCYASPAISDGQLLIRGEKNLYCIGSSATSE